MVAEIYDKFTESLRTAMNTLKDNQKHLSPQKAVFGPKFDDAEQRIKFVNSDFELMMQKVFLRDEVVGKLTKLHPAGFEEFAEHKDDSSLKERIDATNELIAPFKALVMALPPIASLQNTMMSQAQMKKLAIRYDDIKANVAKSKQQVAELNALIEQMYVFAVGVSSQQTAAATA